MVRILVSGEKITSPESPPISFVEAIKSLKGNDLIWLDLIDPEENEIREIAEVVPIHLVTQEDSMTSTREKLEIFSDSNYSFIAIDEMSEIFSSKQLKIIIYNNILITIHPEGVKSIKRVIQRFNKKNQDRLELKPSWIAYGLVDEICNIDMALVRKIHQDSQDLDEQVFKTVPGENDVMLQELLSCRGNIANIREGVWTKQEIIKQMIKMMGDDSELVVFLRDVLDHAIRTHQRISTSTELLNHVHSISLARVSIEMGKHSEEMNRAMNRFSAVATIFLPLTVLTGLWGMNVNVPGQNGGFWPFYVICATISSIGFLMIIFFKKVNWI